MKNFLLVLLGLSTTLAHAQQLQLEALGSLNRSRYSLVAFSDNPRYLAWGARLALGADNLQVGAEYSSNLIDPVFKGVIDANLYFSEDFYGGFVRLKLSRYPAARAGLVLRGGAGFHRTSVFWDYSGNKFKEQYEPILGYNAGGGFSIPLLRPMMLEIGYTYYFVKRPTLVTGDGFTLISEHRGNYSLLSIGLSLNFVFGKRAEKYKVMRQNSKWKYGNKGPS